MYGLDPLVPRGCASRVRVINQREPARVGAASIRSLLRIDIRGLVLTGMCPVSTRWIRHRFTPHVIPMFMFSIRDILSPNVW
jgi:hypothetical protein